MTASPSPCQVLPAGAVLGYLAGGLPPAAILSVEAHLPRCPACRAVLAAGPGEADRLARSRSVVLASLGLRRPGPATWLLRRCGVPDHITTLLSATPALRRSFFAAVLLVLALVTASAYLAAGLRPDLGSWDPLVPFLAIAPLLPLAAVAAAFSPALDPARRLATAAPLPGVWLLCLRSVVVVASTLAPTAVAALILPGPMWLAVAFLLPSLAVCAVALGLGTMIAPLAAAGVAAAAWLACVLGLTVVAAHPAGLVGRPAQLLAAGALAAGLVTLAARRDRLDYGGLA